MSNDRAVLLIAFQFPPFAGSSAVQRTLRFAKYLPQYGWKPIVLTVRPIAYEKSTTSTGNEIPDGVEVHRAFGLDAARHLSILGRYPRTLAIPDRWASWRPFAVRAARALITRHKIRAIWSTFPVATAHAIGRDVASKSGLPWIAEFRDPMWQGSYPQDSRLNAAWKKLEHEVFATASRVIVTTPGTQEMYCQRFPAVAPAKVTVVHNGYDEEIFSRAQLTGPRPAQRSGPVTLLHSGVIYPSERDPTQFFQAIAVLKRQGVISADRLQVILRASGNDAFIQRQVNGSEIADIVRLEPAVGYLAAIEEILHADGLLVLQAANCNAQIPAKLYEYLRAKRPIVALTDPAGDTAQTLKQAGIGIVARLDSREEIATALIRFLEVVREPSWKPATNQIIQQFSRATQAGQVAAILQKLTESTVP